MRYQFVEWLHEFDSEPVAIIQELTDDGWEVRKIEVFPGGSVGLASGRGESGGSALAELPSPDLDAINRSPDSTGSRSGRACSRRCGGRPPGRARGPERAAGPVSGLRGGGAHRAGRWVRAGRGCYGGRRPMVSLPNGVDCAPGFGSGRPVGRH